jgi:hypothetical protein
MPVVRLVAYIAPIIWYQLYKFVIGPIGCVLYITGNFFYGSVFQPLGSRFFVLLTAIIPVFNMIVDAISTGINAISGAMAAASNVVISVLRSFRDP